MNAFKPLIPENMEFSSDILELCIYRLMMRYPFLRRVSAGKSILGEDLHVIKIGNGSKEVFYNGAHHANEWITSLILMRFLEEYAEAVDRGEKIFCFDACALYKETTLTVLPMVNPDGVNLVTGSLSEGPAYEEACLLAGNGRGIPFPDGWKANIRGVDLNLQYPAGWANAVATKAALGTTKPGPRDFPGPSPLSEPESRAVFNLTRAHDFLLTLSFHTQGKVIYWKYLDYEPKNSYAIAEKFGAMSGYAVEETPIVSGFAGYKDWFIGAYNRPGYTIEAGEGISPLPLLQLPEIYKNCLGIMTCALEAAVSL